jgi:uncharacterized phage-associated protein
MDWCDMKNEAKDIIGTPYKAIDIAKYILFMAYENGDLVTNLKLQKLLYYAQAWYMVHHDGKKLFEDEIEAWRFGPVIRDIYDLYKEFSANPIVEQVDKKYAVYLKQEDREFMNEFLGEFMDYSASSLVNMIHHERPWQEAFDKDDPMPSSVISADSMYHFYLDLYEREILFEENEEEYYKKIIEERKNDPVIPIDKVLEIINVGN